MNRWFVRRLRDIATIPNRKSAPAILVRQAYCETGKVKNRTLANLSEWNPARIEALCRALRAEFDHAALAEPTRCDPTTVAEQIKIVKEQFQVEELVFVGDRGMVKSKGKQALEQAKLRHTTALTDSQIAGLLKERFCSWSYSASSFAKSRTGACGYVLRKNETEAAREGHRWEDKLAKLERKIAARNEETKKNSVANRRPENESWKPGQPSTS